MSNTESQIVPANGSALVAKEGFGTRELAQRTETASVAAAARATAMVQAKYVMAMQNRRIFDDVRTELLRECDRPGFAKASRYCKPQGRKKNEETGEWEDNFVVGWSIRFVEAAVRVMGNVDPETETLYDDEHKRIVRCSVTDLEKNTSWSSQITIEKTIERRELKKGQVPLARRKNSYGEDVYILPATDDDVRMKEARLNSITLRTLGLRLIPGDLLDDCLERVMKTQRLEVQQDPLAARKALVDNFAALGVKVADLSEYLGGRKLDEITPDQVLELRAIGVTMRDDGVPWRDVLAASPYVEVPADGPEAKQDPKAAELQKKIAETVGKAKAKRQEKQAKVAAPSERKPTTATVTVTRKPLTDERRTQIAETAGASVEVVAIVERCVASGDTESAIAAALRSEGKGVDQVVLADILAQLRAAT